MPAGHGKRHARENTWGFQEAGDTCRINQDRFPAPKYSKQTAARLTELTTGNAYMNTARGLLGVPRSPTRPPPKKKCY